MATSVEIIERNGLPAKKEPVCVSHLQIGETEQVAPGIWRKLERSDPRCGPCVFNYSTGPDVKFEEVEQVADAAGCKRASFMAFCCPSE
ncbi:hypothetical protein EPN90_03275 [Patescibacteria group bacterium]|nr:MAG: hypothetical protein EPN90_03275 [Patescibacteria group bacterium]